MHNINEDYVQQALEMIRDEKGLPCTCQTCLDDVTVLALNSLPPRYVADVHTTIFFNPSGVVPEDLQAEVYQVVESAIEKVKNSPRH